jgi:hypothetical protein
LPSHQRIFFALPFLFLSIDVAGQEELTLYDDTNGLPRSYINDIRQDRNGYFWMATERGIIRYDGRSFVEVPPKDQAYRFQEVTRLELENDSLYVIYRDSGCMVLDLASLRYRLLFREAVDDILVLPGGDRVATLQSGFIAREREGRWMKRVRLGWKKPGILRYHDGRLFASLPNRGLFQIDPETLRPIRKYDKLPGGFMDAFSASGARLFHMMTGELAAFDEGYRNLRPDPFPELQGLNVTYFTSGVNGLHYVITDNKRLLEYRDHRIRRILMPGITNVELRKLWVQDSTQLMVSTNQGLIHIRMTPSPTTRLLELRDDTSRTIRIRRRILEDIPGRLILFGSPALYTYSAVEGFRQVRKKRIDMYDAVQVGRKVFVATEGGGVVELDPRDMSHRVIGVPPLHPQAMYISILYDSLQGVLLVGGSQELIRYDPLRDRAEGIPIPADVGYVLSLYRDTVTGRYWIGAENAVFCMDGGLRNVLFMARTGRGFRGRLASVLMARGGTRELWVGHERGVDILDMDAMRFRGVLPDAIFRNPRVVSMLEDREGHVWIGTYSGIVGYDPVSGGVCRLNRENGLLNIEYNYKSALRLSDGRLMFGGLNGYDVVDPGRIGFSGSGPRGLITGLHRFSARDTVFEPIPAKQGTLGFNTRDEFLRVYLSSANTLQATRHSYEYDLDGQGQWIGVGSTSHINLLRLDPGLHTLDIRGFDEYGRMLAFDRLVIRAREPFFTSRFFQVILTIAAISFLTLFIAVLLRSRRKEKAIKERISMDLHDEVGTILTRALFVARSGGEPARDSRLIHYLNESLFSLRAYINTMNTPAFPYRALVDEVREMAQTLMAQSPCMPQIRHREEENPLLRGELYRDIRLCLYEIINNTLKHSQADSLRILLLVRGGYLTIYSIDNGVLSSTDELGDGGNGIRNLRKRVSKHNGHIQFGVGRLGNGLWIRMRFGIMA